jgi:hypothetical protein
MVIFLKTKQVRLSHYECIQLKVRRRNRLINSIESSTFMIISDFTMENETAEMGGWPRVT